MVHELLLQVSGRFPAGPSSMLAFPQEASTLHSGASTMCWTRHASATSRCECSCADVAGVFICKEDVHASRLHGIRVHAWLCMHASF